MPEKEYIEREALINTCKKIIRERWNETTVPVSWSHAYADFIDDINNQPAADVAPVKHGYWSHLGGDEFCCTNCGHIVTTDGSWEHPWQNFCPNCGARMDGDADA